MTIELKYLGHSAFRIKKDGVCILIDPFLEQNKEYDYKSENITDIFLTHGHGDHLGDAIKISVDKKATITAVYELANYCQSKKAKVLPISLGGWINYEWGRAIFLPAFHSSSTPDGHYAGCPAGILFEVDKIRIFHAGDTCLNSEMKVLKEVFKPHVAILPIGATYTMDIEQASIAAEWIGAKTVIPMHYNTFSAITADVEEFKKLVDAQNKQCMIVGVNQSVMF